LKKLETYFINYLEMSEQTSVVKILIIGDVCTGKTSVIQRYVYKNFDVTHKATIGVDFALKTVRVDQEVLNVQLWDIAGQERFIGLTTAYYKHAVAAMVVFDVTNEKSLLNAVSWKADVDKKVFLPNGESIPVVLFANKWDLIQEDGSARVLSDAGLEAFCRKHKFVGWFSTSAKTGLNIKRGMNFMISNIVENRREIEKSGFYNEKDNNVINLDGRNSAAYDGPPALPSSNCC